MEIALFVGIMVRLSSASERHIIERDGFGLIQFSTSLVLYISTPKKS